MKSRRVIQILILLLFIFLFIKTKYQGKDFLEYPVNIFLKLDPLIAIGTMLSSRTFISGLFYSFLFVIATIFLGRFFCGWFCPMGTTLDIFNKIFIRKKNNLDSQSWKKLTNIKYYILIFILIGAIINVQFIWLFDPLSILFKTFTASLFPLFDFFIRNVFNFLYEIKLDFFSEPVFNFIKKTTLALKPPVYELSIFILSFFIVILFLELLGRRFWCRVICPLGGLFELLSIKSSVKRNIDEKSCTNCNLCRRECKMGDYDCIMCLNCADICPAKAISFKFKSEVRSQESGEKEKINLTRRALITGSISAAIILPNLKMPFLLKNKSSFLIRPPGALPEDEFLSRCTRCGECMRACITNGLHPAFLESGLYGLWSPKLVPRLGYCEYNCSLCSQVCPTGAIEEISLKKKHQIKIGLAYIDRNRCIPWHKYKDCLVCEEHCPLPDKAIKFKIMEVTNLEGQKVMVKQPHIIEKLCIGCGICENKCPVERSAIIVNKVESYKV